MSGVPIDAAIRHRLPPSSGPAATPGHAYPRRSPPSATAATVTGSVLISAARSDSADASGVRSSSQAAPGPCTRGQPGAPPERELQRGDVGEAGHHLRVPAYRGHVDRVDHPLRAVAAPGAEHPADLRVGERRVEVGRPQRVVAGQVTPPGVRVGREHRAQPPAGEQLDAPGHPLRAGRPGRRDQHHRVAGRSTGGAGRSMGTDRRVTAAEPIGARRADRIASTPWRPRW